LATSSVVCNPLPVVTKLVPEIPSWKSKTKGVDKWNSELMNYNSKMNEIKFKELVDPNLESPMNNYCTISVEKGEEQEQKQEVLIPAFSPLFKDCENYDIVDLDQEKYLSEDFHQLSNIQDNSVDYVITSNLNSLNCNINDIFRESWRILKDGGEICFSGQFSNIRIKRVLDNNHFILKPFYIEDIRRSLSSNGFLYYQTLNADELCFQKTKESKNLHIFYKTLNSFKINTLEDCSEDYGQLATYKGTSIDQPNYFILDLRNSFLTNQPTRVSGNTAEILLKSRLRKHFDVTEKSNHKGPFK